MNTPPRILFILPDFFGGGAQRVLISYANGLGKGFDKSVLSFNDAGPLKEILASDVRHDTLGVRKTLLGIPSLFSFILRNKPDIVLCTMAYVNFVVLIMKPFFKNTAFIIREANMPQAVIKNAGRHGGVYKWFYKILYPTADVIIAPARYIAEQVQKFSGVPVHQQFVLYNPVDTKFVRAKAAAASSTESSETTIHFVAAGRLHWQKGYERLLSALPSYNPSAFWRLDILGDGPDRQKLQALIQEKGLQQSVFLQGFQENPWAYYAAADCFLLPSSAEGLPNVVLESLECGTPVIAMREAGGIAEIAAACAENSVMLADSIDAFLQAMGSIKKRTSSETLLPDIFKMDYAVKELEKILLTALEKKSDLRH